MSRERKEIVICTIIVVAAILTRIIMEIAR